MLASEGYDFLKQIAETISMPVETHVPAHLKEATESALTWINEINSAHYELTGLVGTEDIQSISQTFELGIVLCDGEICAREQIKFIPTDNGYKFEHAESTTPEIPPLLDPPEGIRSTWIDEQLKKYEFIVLLYYRGLW